MVELAAYLSAPDPDAPLVLACTTAERGKPPAALVKIVEPVGEVRQVQIQRKELEPWLVQRAKAAGLDLTPPAARVLVETLGEDIGQLAAALEQLQGAFQGQQVTPTLIHRQFRGLGEQKSWDLCDRAFGKDLPGAIRSLRSIEEGGDDALMVLGGDRRAAPRPDARAGVARPARRRHSSPNRPGCVSSGRHVATSSRRATSRSSSSSRSMHRWPRRICALKSGAPGDVVMPVLIASIAA